MKNNEPVDLGSGFSYSFFQWAPDRDLNPQYDGIADIDKAGIIIWKDGERVAACHFDIPGNQELNRRQQAAGHKPYPLWTLMSLEPLHLEPSIQMYSKADNKPTYHGFIRDGRWVSA